MKQVIIIRKDLGMEKGKIAAQAAHASLQAYKKADSKARELWESSGAKKVILRVDTLKELEELHNQARKAKLPCVIIRDAGKTQVASGSLTALGIGPADENKVDKITGNLKML